MANLNIFPENRSTLGLYGGGVKLFLDPGLTQRATLFDLNGRPLTGNTLNIASSVMPEFQVRRQPPVRHNGTPVGYDV
jgi:hypothetical protein